MSSRILLIFARQPVPGQVKTRLATDLGAERAAEIYEAFVEFIFDSTCHVADERIIAYSPATPEAEAWFQRRITTERDRLWPQPEGDLGERLQLCVRAAWQAKTDRLVIIGTDSPSLPGNVIESAFEALTHRDVVLGPAVDGGYYLVGMRHPYVELFTGIDWGTDQVLSQTLANVQTLGLSLHLLPPWYDVDTVADLRFLETHLRALLAASHPSSTGLEPLLQAVKQPCEPATRQQGEGDLSFDC